MIRNLIYAPEGPLTSELLREPGSFGLGQVPTRVAPDATTSMVCGYCSTGCSLTIHLKDGEGVNLSPSTDYPVNLGMACPKGWEALTVLDAPDRATTPLRRNSTEEFEATNWDTALNEFTRNFQSIQEKHGKHSVAFLSTGQLVNEEMAYLGALAKFGMGMRHGDGNTRQCMATAVVAYKQSFGFDAPPYTYSDFEESDVMVFVGSNLCIAHPIMWERVMRNPHNPEIIVVDPRMTETAMNATQHLALAPKSDQTLFYGLAKLLIDRGWIDSDYIRNHTDDFTEYSEFVQQFPLSRVLEETKLTEFQVERLATTIHEGKRVSFWWTMGVNQSYQGVRTAQALINLALMTGNIGRPGTGANSITGQCNAMGSRLFSNTTNLICGHDFANAEHRQKIAKTLSIPLESIPDENSWAYNEIMAGIDRGEIRGLWVICTNTAHSWINQTDARKVLQKLDYLVVQDMYHSTETAQLADLILPAAGWGEKDGTFINSERRIGRVKKVRKAPGSALSDFNIFRLVADRWGCGEMFEAWDSPEKVFSILQECSRGMPCEITGINDYTMLDANGGIQWPLYEGQVPEQPERRLFEDGKYYHENGRAKFLFEEPRGLSEPTCADYPMLLLTGRGSASQWHTQTRTGKSAVLRKLYPVDPFLEIHPEDARELGIRANANVKISSRRGEMEAFAVITPAVQRGQIFVPMHYEPTNRLTDAVFDPYSKQPSYKSCAVHIEAI